MFKRFIAWFTGKSWTLEDQVFHLEQMIREDNHWIAHDPIARALTDRYLEALSDTWHSKSFESSDKLRSRLDRDPHHPKLTCKELLDEQIDNIEKELQDLCERFENKEIVVRIFDILKNDCQVRGMELQKLKHRIESI